jgi:hypothetical protein
MANNLNYTNPVTGSPVATDDVGSVQYQVVKLDGGPHGVSLPLTGTAEYGLGVDVNRILGTPEVAIKGPAAVSGTVLVGNEVTVNARGPVGVSGTVLVGNEVTVNVRGPAQVSGTVLLGNEPTVALRGPAAVSGTVSIGNEVTVNVRGPAQVSGAVSLAGIPTVSLNGPAAVSGTVLIGNEVTVNPRGPVAVSGTVLIGGEVTTNPRGPVQVSGTVLIGNEITINPRGPVAVSGLVSIVGQSAVTALLSGFVYGCVSSNNSSATALAASGSFSGTKEDVSGYSAITVTIISDKASQSNGIQFAFSQDGISFTTYATGVYNGAATAQTWHLPVWQKFFRITYFNTNSGPQIIFALQTILHSRTPPVGIDNTFPAHVVQEGGPWAVSGTLLVGNEVTVNPRGPVAVSGTVDTELPAAAVLADAAANPTTPTLGSATLLYAADNSWYRARSPNVSGHIDANGLFATATVFFDKSTNLYRAASGQLMADNQAIGSVPTVGAVLVAWDTNGYSRPICQNGTIDANSRVSLGLRTYSANLLFDDVGLNFTRARALNPGGHAQTTGLGASAPVYYDQSTGVYRAPSGQIFGDAMTLMNGPLYGAVLTSYNGSTYDRVRGTSANGLYVQGGVVGNVFANPQPNPLLVGGIDAAGNAQHVPLGINNVDTVGVGNRGWWQMCSPYLFNGQSLDRARSIDPAGHTAAINGLQGVAPAFFDSTLGKYRASSGQILADNVTPGAVPFAASVLYGYDGSNYDRLKSDAAQALTVGGQGASGAAAAGNPVRNGGVSREGIVQDLLVDGFRALVTTSQFGRKATYSATTSGTQLSALTSGSVTSIAYAYHASGTVTSYMVNKLAISYGGGTGVGCSYVIQLRRISNENAAPGGQTITPASYDVLDSASAMTVRAGVSTAPTRDAALLYSWYIPVGTTGMFEVDFTRIIEGKGYTMPGSRSQGLEVTVLVGPINLTTAPVVAATFHWTEG